MVIADFEAASGGLPAVQHFAPRGDPGFTVRSRGRRMVGLKRGRLGQSRCARSKIHPGHDCARSRPHGTALLLAMVKKAKRVTAPARLRSSEA